jgi:hypothetical protein
MANNQWTVGEVRAEFYYLSADINHQGIRDQYLNYKSEEKD